MPKVPAKLELAKVLREMAARYVNMRALDGSFEDRPKAFDRVRVEPIARPFLAGVADCAMLKAAPSQIGIGFQFVGADCRTLLNIRQNVRLKRRGFHVLNNARHDIAAALHHAEDCCLPRQRARALRLCDNRQ
jgi:hypothetical protein